MGVITKKKYIKAFIRHEFIDEDHFFPFQAEPE